jgi:hypothetical protein
MKKRFAFVIELLCRQPIGRGRDGRNRVATYLAGLSKALQKKPVRQPSSHLSKKYGLAAWLPVSESGAIHLYAWDDREPSFISVDIVSSSTVCKASALDYTRKYFGISEERNIVCRSISPTPPTWKELARDVYRQRLTLLSAMGQPPRYDQVVEFLPRLAEEIKMIPLYTAYANRHTAWMHWETSGSILSWLKGTLSLDIYTCKRFDSKKAEDFTRDFFSLRSLTSYDY